MTLYNYTTAVASQWSLLFVSLLQEGPEWSVYEDWILLRVRMRGRGEGGRVQ